MKRTSSKLPIRDETLRTSEEDKHFQTSRNSLGDYESKVGNFPKSMSGNDINSEEEKLSECEIGRDIPCQADTILSPFENLRSWKRWISLSLQELESGNYSSRKGTSKLSPIYSPEGDRERKILTRIIEKERVWEEDGPNLFKKGPFPKSSTDYDIRRLLRSKTQKSNDLGMDILWLEKEILDLWKGSYFTTHFIHNHLEWVKETGEIQMNLMDLRNVILEYRKELRRITEFYEDVSFRWHETTSTGGRYCKTLQFITDMMEQTAEKRMTRLKDAVSAYMTITNLRVIPNKLSYLNTNFPRYGDDGSATLGKILSQTSVSHGPWVYEEPSRHPDGNTGARAKKPQRFRSSIHQNPRSSYTRRDSPDRRCNESNEDNGRDRLCSRLPPGEKKGGRDGDRRERRPLGDGPSPPSSPSDRDGRRNYLPNNDRQERTFVIDLARAIKGENDPYATDLLEGFNSLREMNDFYASLQIPWNVFPRVRGKKETILKEIQMALPEKKFFKGNPDDGTYFPWRVCVIQYIHRAALPITDKIQQITRCVTGDSDALKMEMQISVFTPDTYRRVINSLERMFGGEKRVYNHLYTQLFKGKPLDYNDPNSVQLLRTKIDRFLEHCKANHYLPAHEETMILDQVFQKLMTKFQVTQFREEISRNGRNLLQPIQLDTLSSWLRHRESTLEWVKMHTNPDKYSNKNRRTLKLKTGSSFLATKFPSDRSAFQTGTDMRTVVSPTNSGGKREDEKKSLETTSKGTYNTDICSDHSFSSVEEYGGTDPEFWDLDCDIQHESLTTQRKRFPSCRFCSAGRHLLFRCPNFLGLKIDHRREQVKIMKRCMNCLSPNHTKLDSCPSRRRCKKCGEPHHTLLHREIPWERPDS